MRKHKNGRRNTATDNVASIKIGLIESSPARTQRPAVSLRATLLGSVCAIGLLATLPAPAHATPPGPTPGYTGCIGSGDTLACEGDLSGGVTGDPAYSTLTISNVTSDVGSVGGVTGLTFTNDGPVTVTSNTGGFGIVGEGTGLDAIDLSSYGDTYALSLTQTGDVTSDAALGVKATSWGDVAVTITGNVSADQNGIQAQSLVAGSVTVTQTGDIISYEGTAIDATAANAVTVTATGNLTANQDVIDANSWGTDPSAAVTVTTSGTITSWNAGGINASSAYNTVAVNSSSTITSETDAIHANSSGDANGGTVSVQQTGDITSYTGTGIFAQSAYHDVQVTGQGAITAGQDGIFAKSTGTAADADVTVNQTGAITSYNATGITAQSAWGNVSVTDTGDIVAETDGIRALSSTQDVLKGVQVTQSGTITAYDGYGINAQSANTGVSVSASGAITAAQSGILAASTGDGTTATVSVTHDGGLITSYNSYGIEASSAATNVTVTNTSDILAQTDGIHATMTQTDALGSQVTVNQQGTITAYDGYGIYATATEAGVSITNDGTINSKAGGIYGYATGAAANATVTIDNTGDIATYDGSAIYAYSSSQSVDVTQRAGTLSGGSYGIYAQSATTTASATVEQGGLIQGMNTAGVYLSAITGSTVTNYGEIDGGEYQLAIQTAGYGGTVVNNYGTIDGSIDLSSGYSTFNNKAGGVYNVADLAFDQGGIVYNDGVLSPGGVDTIHEAHIGGDLVQSATGSLLIDVSATEADKIVVAGNVQLSGGLQLKFSDIGTARSIDVLSSYWVDYADLTLLNPAVAATISYPGTTDVQVNFTGLNFAPAMLSAHTTPVGESLNAAYAATSAGMSGLFLDLANIAGDANYQFALDQLTPNLILSENQQAQINAMGFADTLMSCPAGAGYNFAVGQSSCVWGRGEHVSTSQDTNGTRTAYDANTNNSAVGAQVGLSRKLFLGFSFGTENTKLDAGSLGTSTTDGHQFGVALKYVSGPWQFAAALSGGNGTLHTTRQVAFGSVAQTLTSQRDLDATNLRLRAANAVDLSPASYLKSTVDLNVTRVGTSAATETGGSAALSYAAGHSTIFSVTPSLELGTRIQARSDLVVNPFVRVGAYLQGGHANSVSANFAMSDATDGGFTVSSSSHETRGLLALGVNVVKGDLGSLNLVYSRQIGGGTDVGSIALKGTIRF